MDYREANVGDVIRRFVTGWIAAGIVLVIISCVRYRDFIFAAFADNTWAWINAILPAVIMIIGMGYMLKSLFR